MLSTYAGARGGIGALFTVRDARERLESARAIDPDVLDGSVYTTLGTLYYKVLGWPISFGSDPVAREYLERALEINPSGIDPNYFYGEFLAEQGDVDGARVHLERALHAEPRPQRPLADEGRRGEIRKLLSTLDSSG